MAARAKLLFTQNFAANLDGIQSFLETEGRPAFQRLLSRIFDDICPTLSRFPQSGRSFLAHRIGSAEAQIVVDRLRGVIHPGDDLREFTVDDYIILYLVRSRRIYFLAIKHHRQLSFDLRHFWP
jgi:plasmid stabilization system protein ParE